MINSILKLFIVCAILVSAFGCEKDITGKKPLTGTWHFTKWEGSSESLLEEDVPPILYSSSDTVMRTESVRIVFEDEYYSIQGHAYSWQFGGRYSISSRGAWEGEEYGNLMFGANIIYIDPWMEKLYDVLTSAHSYELEGNELIIYDDNQRVFLYKQ